ncbi:porin family protein [Alkalicaulis satelles]|uniref:Porin family protein n=1 Tax=Alkalicaulis satelles TaxID=2609175 RepID=A0A5M6ZB83_9PROT|nr:outer membrane beta-barrel protein [Alkalicaulis satelles]KAA5801037.1 porin family protein [Alkalicaulis satelles]
MSKIAKSVSALALGAAIMGAGAAAHAQYYVSGSAGFNFQTDSKNSGAFTSDFVTGDGVAVPAGVTLPTGTDVGWTTEFDTGLFVAGAAGFRFSEVLRVEAELSWLSADVDTHRDVQAGGNALGAADAAVLITGSAPLGVSVADLVADGRGDLRSLGYAINGYYDFAIPDTDFSLYGGIGLGVAEVKVRYRPSDVDIVDDTKMVGFWQVMAGASFDVAPNTALFAGYRYRRHNDASVQSSLIPADLDVQSRSHILEAGVRFTF